MKLLNRHYDPAVPVDRLTPHPRNARQADCGAIYTSIEQNGFWGALLVQESTGHILAGNHRYLSAKALGAETVPVLFVKCTDEEALTILLADNRIAELGSYDEHALAELVDSVRSNTGLLGTGWDEDALDNLLGDLAGIQAGELGGTKPPKPPKPEGTAIVQREEFDGPNAIVKTPVEPEPDPAPGPVIEITHICPRCSYAWTGTGS